MQRLTLEIAASVFFFAAIPALSCEVRLQHTLSYTCPAVTYSPEDCFEGAGGKEGDRVTSPASIHIMTNGHSYYCPSHESCIEMKDLSFSGCEMAWVPRLGNESKKYAGHFFVGDKKWIGEALDAYRQQ